MIYVMEVRGRLYLLAGSYEEGREKLVPLFTLVPEGEDWEGLVRQFLRKTLKGEPEIELVWKREEEVREWLGEAYRRFEEGRRPSPQVLGALIGEEAEDPLARLVRSVALKG